MKKQLLEAYLDCRRTAAQKLPHAEALHAALCAAAPHFYLRLLGDQNAHVSHRRRMLVNLVQKTEAPAQQLLQEMEKSPATTGVEILEGLRIQRVNCRRARELGLSFLIGNKEFAELAAHRRQRLIKLLKHLLGERTWSSLRRALLAPTPEGERFVKKTVLRYASHPQSALEALQFLAGAGLAVGESAKPAGKNGKPAGIPRILALAKSWMQKPQTAPVEFQPKHPVLQKSAAARRDLSAGEGLPYQTLSGLRGVFHPQAALSDLRMLAAPMATGARTDGRFTALYKEAFFNNEPDACSLERGESPDEHSDLPLPTLREKAARLAVVLDLSASMVSSGERLYHPAALALAAVRRLAPLAAELNVLTVGPQTDVQMAGEISNPEGETDLASALLAAAENRPSAILIVTDGYENVRQGDVAQVARGLDRLRWGAPLFQVTPRFAEGENLADRRLSDNIPLIPLDHERGVAEVLARVSLAALPETVAAEQLESFQTFVLAS